MIAISASTFSPLFYKGVEANISTFSIQDAAIIMSTDTHRFFVDSDQNARVEISDLVKGYTSTQIVAKSAGAIYKNKLYWASDTNHFYVYKYDSTQETDVAVDITNFKVSSASSADYAAHASTADMYHSDESDHATNADTATYATNAGTATYATNAGTATHASTADYATSAGTASYANGPADNSDWDFGNSSEFGNLSALTSS